MRLVLVLSLMLLLSSCASKTTYLREGTQVGPIVVPAGVAPIQQEPYYPIPNNIPPAQQSKKPVSLAPATMMTTDDGK